jgi:serine/threonine protein phosphatase PrpC
MVGDEKLLGTLQEANTTPASAVEKLVEAANAAGGKDNISVIVIKISG